MAKNVTSNMSGIVMRYLVKPGDSINVDQDILVLESMKMEMTVQSVMAGKVKELSCQPEDFVQEGETILVLE